MSQDAEKYRSYLVQLQIEENRPAALKEIKNLLELKNASEAATTIRDSGITKIVQCLNVSDKSLSDLTCEVLKICFEKFEPNDVVKYFITHIMYLLRHEMSCARKLAVDQVYKAITFDASLLPVQYNDVFIAVAQLVGDSDIGISNKAVHITSNLPFEAYANVLEEMKIILQYDGSSKCNVYEVIINISTKSYELFELSVQHGYFDHIVQQLDSNDVLYLLNILELLSRIAVKPYGINHLVKEGGLKKISDLISDPQKKPVAGLLTPGYMKFFGCIAHYYPREIFEKYPSLLNLLFDAFENGDHTVLPVTLDTLGFIGCTVEGKLCLAALGSKYTQALDSLAQIIKNSPTELKVRALHCYASLIGYDKDVNAVKSGNVDQRVTLMTREWFRTLSCHRSSIEYLFEICKNPFPDIRLAAFALLNSVCQHRWGEEIVSETAGFIEFLLDRSWDHSKESKEAKYDIIKRLSTSSVFDENIKKRLQAYVEQGSFYSETALEVAMEEDN